MTRGLLDTSVFIAREGRGLDAARLPDEVAVSVITYGELRAGVLAALDLSVRSRRLAPCRPSPTSTRYRSTRRSPTRGPLRLRIAESGRRMNVNDTWIAATALAHGVPVVSQDADFDVLTDLGGLRVLHV